MFQQLKFLYHILKFAKDPTNTVEVFKFTDMILNTATREEMAAYEDQFLTDESARALYASGNPDYLHKPYDIDELLRCPPGSLGRVYASNMRAAGLDPEFFRYAEVKDASTYFAVRFRKTHDIFHAVTGFGTDVPGELGLQGFYLAQLHTPIPLSILVSGLLFVLASRDRDLIKEAFQQIAAGYQMGQEAVLLHGIIWEDLWNKDLQAVRQSLKIAPFQGKTAVREPKESRVLASA